jgi:CrcB protein
MPTILYIALGGVCGTLARYGTAQLMVRWLGERFAWGTLAVNLLGCFILGYIMQHSISAPTFPRELKLALTVGFLGAFTTFSTFGYETFGFLQQRQPGLALANVAANVVLGLLLVWLGSLAAK